MTTLRTVLSLLALTLAPVLAVPASALANDMKGMNMGKAGAADKAFMASMRRTMKGMDVKPTGNADKDFVGMMVPHHQGAIDMARIELRYGKDPMLRKMAVGIIRAQQQEIGEMKAWTAGKRR